VVVKWETLSETDTYRFYIQRQGTAWVTIDSVDAGGTSLSRRQYAVTDATVPAVTWTYRIKELDRNGAVHYSPTVSTTLEAISSELHVTAYALEQNYPNPFNPVTTIRFALPVAGNVTLRVFNLLGQETATLVNENRPAGEYSVPFNGSGLSSGVYFYRLQAGSFEEIKSLVLLR
jgi:hypothetical protein